jgi:uncharacterized protein YlzI (FlbEa/FlbD family)
MIPLDKINALCKLTPKNVLAPRDICLNNRDIPVGFTMDYVSDTVFLCWLFNRGWRIQNNVTPDMITKLINKMRETTITLHNEKCVVGDYNEMQFLTNKSFSDVYFCDTDSYQIGRFGCTAIMDTVRDRILPFGQFNEGSDWFAFAVVTSQLFTGVHPYKGRHPDYTKREVNQLKLMDENISIFNPLVTMPKQAQPLNSIPHNIRDWYEEVLERKWRDIPPKIGTGVQFIVMPTRVLSSTDTFEVKEALSIPELIRKICLVNGKLYIVGENTLYLNDRAITSLPLSSEHFVVKCEGDFNHIRCEQYGKNLHFYHLPNPNQEIYSCLAHHVTTYDGELYIIRDGSAIKCTFKKMFGKVMCDEQKVGDVFTPTVKAFPGVFVQDILGIPWIGVPNNNSFNNIQLSKLIYHRIIDAKYEGGICLLITEHKGKTYRTIVSNDGVISEECDSTERANFTTVGSVAAIIIGDEELRLRVDVGTKVIQTPPFDSSMTMCSDGARVLVINGKKLLHISTKH